LDGDATGLSSIHNGPQDDHPGNWACDTAEIALLEAVDELSKCGGRALPTSVFLSERRNEIVHRITYAKGGNYVKYRGARGRAPQIENTRGTIRAFSGRSRRRLLAFFNSVDRSVISPEQVWFVTLTYPGVWSDDPEQWKADLKAFRKRMERAWGALAVIWKIEPQKRGAPHFHLMILVPSGMTAGMWAAGRKRHNGRWVTVWIGGKLSDFREFCSRAWFEVVKSGDHRHRRAGTTVEPLESWNKAVAYAAKYIGKEVDFFDRQTGEVLEVGRFWGIWRRELWPVHLVSFTLGEHEWVKIRRHVRRYLKRRGPEWDAVPRPISFFMPGNEFERILQLVIPALSEGGRFSDVWQDYQLAPDRTDWGDNLNAERIDYKSEPADIFEDQNLTSPGDL